jgi:flagellar L-ring protein precursor FlgH
VVTIQIQEKYSAKQSSNSTLDRKANVEANVGLLPFLTPNVTKRMKAEGSSANTFEGKGETGTDNEFTGTITTTVVEVLSNGNLVVVGEKQVGINQNVERLRFSGVVNPATILPGNVVTSTQVADARLEVRSRGDIDRAQTAGWLSRFFLSFLPI